MSNGLPRNTFRAFRHLFAPTTEKRAGLSRAPLLQGATLQPRQHPLCHHGSSPKHCPRRSPSFRRIDARSVRTGAWFGGERRRSRLLPPPFQGAPEMARKGGKGCGWGVWGGAGKLRPFVFLLLFWGSGCVNGLARGAKAGFGCRIARYQAQSAIFIPPPYSPPSPTLPPLPSAPPRSQVCTSAFSRQL